MSYTGYKTDLMSSMDLRTYSIIYILHNYRNLYNDLIT